MRIIDRFDKYLEVKGLNDNKVTVQLGLSIGLIGKARKEGGDLGKKSIEKILSFYADLNRVWLLTGQGEMFNQVPNVISDSQEKNITKSIENNYVGLLKEKDERIKEKDERIKLLEELKDNIKSENERLKAEIERLKKEFEEYKKQSVKSESKKVGAKQTTG